MQIAADYADLAIRMVKSRETLAAESNRVWHYVFARNSKTIYADTIISGVIAEICG